jgi:sugar fermentation stimulation protein A
MFYSNIHKGVFISRPNRFIAEVEINGRIEICHVKNTGRCKELLVPGAAVYANFADNPSRATKYDLVAVEKGSLLINMDSQAPNRAFEEFLRQGSFISDITHIKTEVKYGDSRFDFYIETTNAKAFIEVKGVTLEEDGVALFPDAPTVRGVKHLNELAKCVSEGYEAYVIFVIQMKGITHYTPNNKTHAAFGEALGNAMNMGVKAIAYDCEVMPDEMRIGKKIPIKL